MDSCVECFEEMDNADKQLVKSIKPLLREVRGSFPESGIEKYFIHSLLDSPNIVAAQRGSQIIAPLQYKGMMHAEFFEAWFEHELIPLLTKSEVVVMDDASFHRKNCLNNIAQKYGIKIIFLPPYSPELNPIEHFWHWLKKKSLI